MPTKMPSTPPVVNPAVAEPTGQMSTQPMAMNAQIPSSQMNAVMPQMPPQVTDSSETPSQTPEPMPMSPTQAGGMSAHIGGSSKKPLIIALVVLVLVLVIGGVFVLMSRQPSSQKGTPEPSSDSKKTVSPSTAPTVTEAPSAEQTELDSVDLGNVDSDFKDVESDISKL
jgi:uncharacterized protein HemX